jgi:hypothetical protein
MSDESLVEKLKRIYQEKEGKHINLIRQRERNTRSV